MSIFSRAAWRFGLLVWKRRNVRLRNTEPIVSFTFDDFPRSALTAGGAILQNYGGHGTYYTAMGLMGMTNHEGEHFSVDDLHQLVRDGHELGSHTYGHSSARRNGLRTFQEDVMRGESELALFFANSSPGNFAYPYGEATFASKPAIGSRFRSCRGTRGGVMGPFADLNLLLANHLYSHCFDMSKIEKLIEENQKRCGWLIFYTHDVRENASDYGCSPTEFESVVRAASRSGARILTISQALNTIDPEHASAVVVDDSRVAANN